ncbi:MAG: helix-hairpin-helix domain-containing protein [Dokdonella sp.]
MHCPDQSACRKKTTWRDARRLRQQASNADAAFHCIGRDFPRRTLTSRLESNQEQFMNMKTILASLALSLALALPAFAAEPVDINSADASTLAEGLTGVGLSKAEAIIAYRDEHGPFASAEDLAQVKGIGDKLVERNRENIVVGGAKAKASASKSSAKSAKVASTD